MEASTHKLRSNGLWRNICFQDILSFALPVVVQNISGKDNAEVYEIEKEVKKAFAVKYFPNPENLRDNAKWFIDTAYAISLNFLRTGYVQLGKFFKNVDDIYNFTECVNWDLLDDQGRVTLSDDTFGDQTQAFYAISARRVQNKLKKFGWTDGQSISDENFTIRHAGNTMVDECVKCTAGYLPPYAAYCGVTVEDDFMATNMFAKISRRQTGEGDIEIPTESLFNSTDIVELESCCLRYEIRHMFDGCFACCAYLREFDFDSFAHTHYSFGCHGLAGISMNNFFYNCCNLLSIKGPLPSPTDISYMCSGCISLEKVQIDFDMWKLADIKPDPTWDGLSIHYAVGAFANCIHLTWFEIDYAIWIHLKNCSYMFENCLSLQWIDLKFINYLQPLNNDNEQYYFNVHEFTHIPEISTISDFNIMLNNRVEYVNIRASLNPPSSNDRFSDGPVLVEPSPKMYTSSEIKVHIDELRADSYAARSSAVISPVGSTAVGLEYRCSKMFRNCWNLYYIRITEGLDHMHTIFSDDKSYTFDGCLSFRGFIARDYEYNYFKDYIPGDYISDVGTVDPLTYTFNVVANRIEGWLGLMTDCMFIKDPRLMDNNLREAEYWFRGSDALYEFPSPTYKEFVRFDTIRNYFIQRRTVSPHTPFIIVNWTEFNDVWRVNIQSDPTNSFETSMCDYLIQLGKSYR